MTNRTKVQLSGKVRLPSLLVVLWLFGAITGCCHGTAFADEALQTIDVEKYRWHTRIGLQVAHQCPDFRYDPVNPSDVRAWNDNRNDASTRFSFVSLQRDLDERSNLELSYTSDGSRGKIYGKQSFFTLRRDLEIDMKSLKLQYSRTLWQKKGFSFGASASVQGVLLSMKANLPFYGYQNEEYLVAVPALGAFAGYRTKGAFSYRLSSEYMTLPLGDIEGKLIEVNARAAYRVTERFMVGLGYRFSERKVSVHRERYDLGGFYEVHGYQLYTGFDF